MKPLIFFISFIILISCNGNKTKLTFQTTESGIEYAFIKKNSEGKKPQIGDGLVLSFHCYTMNDSLIFTSSELSSNFRLEFKQPQYNGSIDEVFELLNQNDSIIFLIEAHRFYRNTLKMLPPLNIKPGDKIKFNLKLNNVIDKKQIEKERAEFKEKSKRMEEKFIKEYINANKITQEPSLSGLYYISKKEGKGKQATAGKQVTIHYSGYLINGELFDTSIDREKPITFLIGSNTAIPGMEEGLVKMKEGGKAIMLIPSYLAYGEQGKPPRIPPFATLVFEIDLIKVE